MQVGVETGAREGGVVRAGPVEGDLEELHGAGLEGGDGGGEVHPPGTDEVFVEEAPDGIDVPFEAPEPVAEGEGVVGAEVLDVGD
jgi:hypothetical protein